VAKTPKKPLASDNPNYRKMLANTISITRIQTTLNILTP
jgi:hypothetical protein